MSKQVLSKYQRKCWLRRAADHFQEEDWEFLATNTEFQTFAEGNNLTMPSDLIDLGNRIISFRRAGQRKAA